MAKKRTKKQKKQADKIVRVSKETGKKNKSTKMSETQVSLVYRDLLKTAVVSLIVFILLLLIFAYVR